MQTNPKPAYDRSLKWEYNTLHFWKHCWS